MSLPLPSPSGTRRNLPAGHRRLAALFSALAFTATALGGAIAVSLATEILWGALTRAAVLPEGLAPLKDAATVVLFLGLVSLVGTTIARPARTLPVVADGARRLALVASVVLTAQTGLGAFVRYAYLGSSATAMDTLAAILPAHRLGSLFTLALMVASAVAMYRATAQHPWLRGLSLAVGMLVLAQVAVGLQSATGGLAAESARAHVGVGVALLATQWGLYLATSAATRAVPVTSWRFFLRQLVALAKLRITVTVALTFAGGMWLTPVDAGLGSGLAAMIGTLLVVSAANALNMYLERDLDGRMSRTRNRPLPLGTLGPETALAAGTVMVCIGLPLLLVGSNGITAALGLLAFVSYVFAYTPMKTASSMALFVGAIPGAMPPLMGWTAATGQISTPGLLIFGVLFAWQIPHFIAIAIMRADEYAAAGIKVLPVEYGVLATRVSSMVFALATVGCSLALVAEGTLGWVFGVLAGALGLEFIRRSHAPRGAIATTRDPAQIREIGRPWARRLFGWSIVYLCLLFVAVAADRLLAVWVG